MKDLDKLFNGLIEVEQERNVAHLKARAKIQAVLEPQWRDWSALNAAVAVLESGEGAQYTTGDFGDMICWIRFDELSDIPERERPYFEEYLQELCLTCDFEHGVLQSNLGHDCIIIQDDTRFDNGVWQEHKQIIDQACYEVDGEVDEALRNQLIENHMERTGYFPGVFRLTRNGDAYPVQTQAVKA